MALIKRETPQEPKITQSANTERNVQSTNNNTTPQKKVLTAQDRKNIKVTPVSFSKIKTICTMKSMKNYEFIDEICAHNEFKHFCVHMPGRFSGNSSEWGKGEMIEGNVTYPLPVDDERFQGAQSNRNAFIDKKNKCYYFRDDSKRLYKIGASEKYLKLLIKEVLATP